MIRALWLALVAALGLAALQSWRLEATRAAWAQERADAAIANAARREAAMNNINAARVTYDTVMEQADALPKATDCGLSADRARLLRALTPKH